MRTKINIFIIIFVFLSLYIIRDDLFKMYNGVSSFLESKYTVLPTVNQIKSNISQIAENTIANTPITEIKKSIKNPAPLKVLDSVFITNINSIDLSSVKVIDWTNINRMEVAGLPALKENPKLDNTAEQKLKDMFTNQYFEHISPNGVGASDLASESGYNYILIGENLALGNFKDEKNLLDAWMASPGHRANILNTHYTEIGVAVGRGMFNGEDTWLAVQHFGAPINLCPTIDTILKDKIETDKTQLSSMSVNLIKQKDQIDQGSILSEITNIQQINNYNSLVAAYNNLIKESKSLITKYNNQVTIFNSCVDKMTTT